MSIKKIKEYYNEHLSLGDERIVDVDKWTIPGIGTYVNIVTITKNHVIWKNEFEIIGGCLKTIHNKCLG